MFFDAWERGSKLLNFHDYPVGVYKCPESLSRAKSEANEARLGPTNYSQTAGSTFQKADSWQKGVNSCQKCKLDKLPRSRLPLTRRGRRILAIRNCHQVTFGFLSCQKCQDQNHKVPKSKSPKVQKSKSQKLQKFQSPKSQVPCLLYTSPSPRDGLLSRMPSSA